MNATATMQKYLTSLRGQLNAKFVERSDAIDAMLLALMAGEHAILIGPPGTAKSALSRELARSLTGARYFECALSKTRPAEAVLGPMDLKVFRDTGEYVLKREGYATDSDIIMLDEIGKMSAVLGHDLLALLNERIYHEVSDGKSAHAAPLSTAICASNELLTDGQDDAIALWDRILVRCTVEGVSSRQGFMDMLTSEEEVSMMIPWEDLRHEIDHVVPVIQVGAAVLNNLMELREELKEAEIFPSDRRWRAAIKALRASAYLNGRSEVEPEDLGCLRFVLWETPEQIPTVTKLTEGKVNPFLERLDSIGSVLTGMRAKSIEVGNEGEAFRSAEYLQEAGQKLRSLRDQLDMMLIEAGGAPISGFKRISDEHAETVKIVMTKVGRQDDELADVMVSKFMGAGDGGNR